MVISGPIEHRIFGTLLGVWLGFLYSKRFPPESFHSVVYLFYTLTIIGLVAIILRAGFTRPTRGQRLVSYFALLVAVGLLIPGTQFFGNSAYTQGQEITGWELSFLAFILLFWCLSAEIGESVERLLP